MIKFLLAISSVLLNFCYEMRETTEILKEGQFGPYSTASAAFTGNWKEYATTRVEGDNTFETVIFYIRTGVGQTGWVAGTIIQTYTSFEDRSDTGVYES